MSAGQTSQSTALPPPVKSYDYPSPLQAYLTDRTGKSSADDSARSVAPNLPFTSSAYDRFPAPIRQQKQNGFDVHVYFHETDPEEVKFATELHRRIQLEFPEIPIFPMIHYPVGPHPIAMFETHVHTPKQFGAYVSWLVINRGPLSVLVHPNTSDMVRDHSQRASWLGTPVELSFEIFKHVAHK